MSYRQTKQPSLKELTAVSHTQLLITSLSFAIWLHWWETNLVAGWRALSWARAQTKSKDQHPSIHHSETLQQWWLYFRDARSWESVSLRDELPVGTYCIAPAKPCNIYPHKQPEPQVRWRKPQDVCLMFSRTSIPATHRRHGSSMSLGTLSTNPTSWLTITSEITRDSYVPLKYVCQLPQHPVPSSAGKDEMKEPYLCCQWGFMNRE